MASNVYTKNEIIKELSTRGYFIDALTLDTFFQKWKIEAIFEDEQGSEFYDKDALELVLEKLFNQEQEKEIKQEIKQELKEELKEHIKEKAKFEEKKYSESNDKNASEDENCMPNANIPEVEKNNTFNSNDKEANDILKNMSLSDGTPLIEKVQEVQNFDNQIQDDFNLPIDEVAPMDIQEKPVTRGILDAAMEGINTPTPSEEDNIQETQQEINTPSENPSTIVPEVTQMNSIATPIDLSQSANFNASSQDSADFDDISLLSESLEAQERFKNYIVSELSKKNVDLTTEPPKQNEFKLDISERTLSMIARTMAKKIAKHVSMICSADAKATQKIEDYKEKNEKLEQKAKELEEQNKKLRLLLVESNKNLNSYKPSFFGLYKKVDPNK